MPARKKQNTQIPLQRLLLWILLATLVVVISIWGMIAPYAIEKYYAPVSLGPVRALVYSPKYLSANEDEEIRFAFENPSANPVIATFGLENNSALTGFLGLLESNIVYSGTVSSRQQINRQAKVFFYVTPVQFGEIDTRVPRLGLWASIDNSTFEKKNLDIYLAPIPLARSLSYYLGGILSGLGVFFLREMWNEAKRPVKKELLLEFKRIGSLFRRLWEQIKKPSRKKR
jgi:hypothetical protein